MHENNKYLGPNLLGFFNKIADYGQMVALLSNILGDLVNTNLLSDKSIMEVFHSFEHILLDFWELVTYGILKIDKNHFFPNGYLILTFFPLTIFFSVHFLRIACNSMGQNHILDVYLLALASKNFSQIDSIFICLKYMAGWRKVNI